MSVAGTISYLLQTSVKPSLVARFPSGSPAVRLANEQGASAAAPTAGKPVSLPAIVISGRDIDINYTVKKGGRFARNTELRVTCRVDGSATGSEEAIEQLAVDVDQAIEPVAGDWLFFQPFRQDDERSWEGNTRVLTLVWRVIALAGEE